MSHLIPATLTPEDASRRPWFAVVVGAGVAGAPLAASLASDGRAVLLLDKATFPRAKTCGGTLNPRAVRSLRRLGFEAALTSLEPNRIHGVEWRQPTGSVGRMDFDRSDEAYAVSRGALDAALVREAIARGAYFLPGATCLSSRLEGDRRVVRLRTPTNAEQEIPAEVVLACDGLGSVLASGAGLTIPARTGGVHYIGASVVTPQGDYPGAPSDRILMAVGRRGYVGVVRVEGGRWNIAAAIRLPELRGSHGPDWIAKEILSSINLPMPSSSHGERWTVTQPRLRRAVIRPCAERLLLVGDAAGYVEPITGEGMAWALHAVETVRTLLRGGWREEAATSFERDWRQNSCRRQLLVRLAGGAARSPMATSAALAGLRLAPGLGGLIARRLAREHAAAGASR